MNIGGPNFISSVIANHFFERKTRHESLASLIRCHFANPVLYPAIDEFTVNYYYTMLECGIFNIVSTQVQPQQPVPIQQQIGLHQLIGLPVQPLQVSQPAPQPPVQYLPGQEPLLTNKTIFSRVIHELKGRDQKAMRRVCKDFWSFIDEENRIFDLLRVTFTGNAVVINEKSGFKEKPTISIFKRVVVRNEPDDEKSVTEEEKETAERMFIVNAIASFNEKIGKSHTKVQKLIVKQKKETAAPEDAKFFFEKLAEGMGRRLAKLQVERIEILSSTTLQMDALISHCHVGTLKRMELNLLESNESEVGVFGGFKSHQNSLTRLEMSADICPLSLDSIASIDNLNVCLQQPTLDEIQRYREVICSKTTQFSHILEFATSSDTFYNGMNPEMIIHDEDYDEDDDKKKPVARMPRTGAAKGNIVFCNITRRAVILYPTEKTF